MEISSTSPLGNIPKSAAAVDMVATSAGDKRKKIACINNKIPKGTMIKLVS